jgi:pimeloyl-ACP methyl ester carboxylesterase
MGLSRLAAVIPLVAGLFVATTSPVHADAARDLKPFYTQQVAWAPCPDGWVTPSDGVECATLVVPLDYRRPKDGSIQVVIDRKRAVDPARRRGILLTNPGGPGGSGLRVVNWLNGQEAAKVYDVIGMDPRGVGRSTQLLCVDTTSNATFPSRPTDAELVHWTDFAKAVEHNCQRGGGDMRRFVNSMNTARDMDVVRGALGEAKLNFLGYSYGTHLGSVYGSLFPTKLDRSILDSALDPTKTWHGSDPDVVQAIGLNFEAWADWTAARDSTFGLGRDRVAVRAAVEEIAARLTTGPVGGFKDRTEFDNAVGFNTRYRKSWAAFARTLKDIRAGSADEQDVRAMVELAAKGQIEPTSPGTYYAVTCEWDWSTNVQGYYRDMRKYRVEMPYGGGVEYGAPQNCTFREFTRPELLPKITRKYPAGLVINSEGDIQTPYINGQAMAEHLREPLISVANDGQHGHYALRKNACVDELVNRYLVSGILPNSRVVCPATDVAENALTTQSTTPLSAIAADIVSSNQVF